MPGSTISGNQSPLSRRGGLSRTHSASTLDARSTAGTYVSNQSSAVSSSNTFQRRERAIWGKPTYKYQSLDPAKPYYVDPRILQIVAKNTPGELDRISIPDGMNVHGKIHVAEKPKALLALKQVKEERKLKAEEEARRQRKREALAALNRTVTHLNLHQTARSGEVSVQEWMSSDGGDSHDLHSPSERPGVSLLLHRSRSPERAGPDSFARHPSFLPGKAADLPSALRPAAAQVVRKAGRKYHDLPEASASAEWGASPGQDQPPAAAAADGKDGAATGSFKRVINFPLPWADKIREAKKRKAAAAGAAGKSGAGEGAGAASASDHEDWEAILGKGPADQVSGAEGGMEESASRKRRPARARIDTGRRKATPHSSASAAPSAAPASQPAAAADGDVAAAPVNREGTSGGAAAASAAAASGGTVAAAAGSALDQFLRAPPDQEQEAAGTKRKKPYDVEFVKQWMAKKKQQEHREKEREQLAEEARQRQRQSVLLELKSLTVEQGRKYRQRLADKQTSDDQTAAPDVRRPRGVHPWELAPSASSHVEKEIAPPQERLRKMHEYGNQVRKKRGILAQAVHSRHAQAGARARRSTRPRSSSPARRPRPGSLGDAEGADKEESDDEEQAGAPALGLEPDELATDEDAAPGEDEGEAAEDGDLTGADQAPQTVGLPADADKQQDAKGQGAAGPTETDTKAVPAQGREGARQKRVALLAPKTAWASQLTRRAELQQLLGAAARAGKQPAEVGSADAMRGRGERKEDAESADEESTPLISAGAQKAQRLHALRDAAENLSALESSLSRERREARAQADISQPLRAVLQEELADMQQPLRLASRAEAGQAPQEALPAPHLEAPEADARPTPSELVEEEIDGEWSAGEWSDGDAGGESSSGRAWDARAPGANAGGKSIDESLKQVEQQIESRKKARETQREAKAHAQERAFEDARIRTVVAPGSFVRGVLPSREFHLGARGEGEEEQATGPGVLDFSKDRVVAGRPPAPDTDHAFESIEVQRSRLQVLAQRSGHARLFVEEEEDGGLADMMADLARDASVQDRFSLLNTLQQEASQVRREELRGAQSHPAFPADLALVQTDARAAGDAGMQRQLLQETGAGQGQLQPAAQESPPSAAQESPPSAADLLIARANQLLQGPSSSGPARARAQGASQLWQQRILSGEWSIAGGSMPAEEQMRHQRHVQQYLQHRDGLSLDTQPLQHAPCIVDLVFEPAWGTLVGEPGQAAQLDARLPHGGEVVSGGLDEIAQAPTPAEAQQRRASSPISGAPLEASRRAAEAVLAVAECLMVPVERFKVVHVDAGDNLLRLQVSGGGESVGRGVLDQVPTHEIVARLVAAAVDGASGLRQRAALSLLRDCLVHTSPAANTLQASRQLLAGASTSVSTPSVPYGDQGNGLAAAAGLASAAPAAFSTALGCEAPSSHGARPQGTRLTPAELQQRLLAEVDYLDEMHNAEQHLASMVQIQQVAGAQEEAVVLAQALLDRERVAAEEAERQHQSQVQLSQANQQLASHLQQALKETTESFMQALRSATAQRDEPSAHAVDEMRQEHARQLQQVVDAFKDSLSAVAARAPASAGGEGGRQDRIQRSPARHSQPPSPHAGSSRDTSGATGYRRKAAEAELAVDVRKDSSTSAVESDYTADFEDINEQSLAEQEPALDGSPHASIIVDEADALRSPLRKHADASESIQEESYRSQGRASSRGAAGRSSRMADEIYSDHFSSGRPESERSRAASPSMRVEDDDHLLQGSSAGASMLHEDTIEDQIGDHMASRSVRESMVATEASASRLSRQSAHVSQSQHYSQDDFEEEYSDDFESRISMSVDASTARKQPDVNRSVAASSGALPSPAKSRGSAHRQPGAPEASVAAQDGEMTLSEQAVDLKLIMPHLPEAMQEDRATQQAVKLVQDSLKQAQVRAEQQLALLGLQEQALDQRALVELRRISDEHAWLERARGDEVPGGAHGREMRQQRLDEEERKTRMRLSADKADVQRQRAAARAELLRRQVDLQEQCNSFLASRRETMVVSGALSAHHAALPELQFLHQHQHPAQQVAHEQRQAPPPTLAAHARGDRKDGRRLEDARQHVLQEGEEGEEGEESYLSDAFESVASEALDYLGDDGGAQMDAEQQSLHMQSVRQLAEELGKSEMDPSGRLLHAREKSAAEKRQFALQLLDEKEAAVTRRRRELVVEAEERRTAELLDRALRLNVDEEARKAPAPDPGPAVWDILAARLPGTPASFVGDVLGHDTLTPPRTATPEDVDPGAQVPPAYVVERDGLVTPVRSTAGERLVSAVGGGTGLAVDMQGSWVDEQGSWEQDDDDITPPRSVPSAGSPDSQGLFVRTAFDPLSAAGATHVASAPSASDDLSDVSFEDMDARHHESAASAISESIEDRVLESGSDRQGADSIIEEVGADSAGTPMGQRHSDQHHVSEIAESIDESAVAGRRGRGTPQPMESVGYSMDFDDAPDDASAPAASVSQAVYSQDFEDASSSLVPRQSVAYSEAYSQDFEPGSASDASRVQSAVGQSRGGLSRGGSRNDAHDEGVISEELDARASRASVVGTGAESEREGPEDGGYSNSFEAESQAYSNTFELDSSAAPARASGVLPRKEEQAAEAEEILEETAAEGSLSGSIAEELDASRVTAASSSRAPSPGRSPPVRAGGTSATRAEDAEAVAVDARPDSPEADSQVYSDSFVGESASQSMLLEGRRDSAAGGAQDQAAAPSPHNDSRSAHYSDSFVAVDSEGGSEDQAPHQAQASSPQQPDHQEETRAQAPQAHDASVGDSVGTDMSHIAEESMDEEAKTAAAETVQRAVRACVARRALLALRHEAHVTDAARQHDNVPDAAVPHVPPTPPSPQQEETDQGAASGGHYSSDFAQESMVQESMDFSEGIKSAKSASSEEPEMASKVLIAANQDSPQSGAKPDVFRPLSRDEQDEQVEEDAQSKAAAEASENEEEAEPAPMPLEVAKGEESCAPISTPPLSSASSPTAAPSPERDSPHEEAHHPPTPPPLESPHVAAVEATAAAAGAARAERMIAVSDSLLALVLEEVLASIKHLPKSAATASAPAASVARSEREWRDSVAAKPHDDMSAPRTPSPKKGGDSDESSDVSPGALALMAELVHESSPPRVSSPKPSGGVPASAHTESLPAGHIGDAAEQESEDARIARAGASMSTDAATAYARLFLDSIEPQALVEGLGEEIFLHVARGKFAHVSQDQQVFHKLVFDAVRSLLPSCLAAHRCKLQSRYSGSRSAYGAQLPLALTAAQAASVKQELVKNVARLAERGRCLPSSTPGAPSASTDPDLAALHALVDDDLVEMEKHWLQYDEEEDVISIAVADAILDDLLFDITSELVLL